MRPHTHNTTWLAHYATHYTSTVTAVLAVVVDAAAALLLAGAVGVA